MLTNVPSYDMLSDWNGNLPKAGGNRLSEGKERKFDPARLRAAMDRADMGPTKLERESGVSRGMIHHLLNGTRNKVSGEILSKIAKALNQPLTYFMSNDDDTPPINSQLPETIRQLAEIASRLSQLSQHELLRIAATLAKLELEQRDKAAPPLTGEDRAALLRIAEELKQAPGQNDLLDSLETLLRKPPNGWTVDLRPPGQGPDDPGQDQ